jgi:hypothetical protein
MIAPQEEPPAASAVSTVSDADMANVKEFKEKGNEAYREGRHADAKGLFG